MRRWHYTETVRFCRSGAQMAGGEQPTNALNVLTPPLSPVLGIQTECRCQVADIERKDGYACQLISGMRMYPPLRESWTRIEHLSGCRLLRGLHPGHGSPDVSRRLGLVTTGCAGRRGHRIRLRR